MIFLIKSSNKEGEIEFYRAIDGELVVSIMNGYGTTYYTMNEDEIKCLIDYIKITDERI